MISKYTNTLNAVGPVQSGTLRPTHGVSTMTVKPPKPASKLADFLRKLAHAVECGAVVEADVLQALFESETFDRLAVEFGERDQPDHTRIVSELDALTAEFRGQKGRAVARRGERLRAGHFAKRC